MFPSLVGSTRRPPTGPADLVCHLTGWGYAHLKAAEIPGLRRQLPAWAVEGTQGHFFKHADEQTLLAVQAVDDAIRRHGFDPRSQQDFAVLAAPRFLGRQASVAVIRRFRQIGAQGVTPHIISQHSLHSVSGALSVLLGCKGPNLGVGGGPHALDDALLTQLTLLGQDGIAGVWLVGTGWDPEPVIDLDGNCQNEPECFAFALAIQQVAAVNHGSLRLCLPPLLHADSAAVEVTPANLVRQMQAADLRHTALQMRWQLNWGASLEIELSRPSAVLSRAV